MLFNEKPVTLHVVPACYTKNKNLKGWQAGEDFTNHYHTMGYFSIRDVELLKSYGYDKICFPNGDVVRI